MASNPVTSGLKGQYDARTLVLNDGDLVSNWADQSGNGHDLVSSSSARPRYKTNIYGSQPAVRFGGSGVFMDASSVNFETFAGYSFYLMLCNNTIVSGASYYNVENKASENDTGGSMVWNDTSSSMQIYCNNSVLYNLSMMFDTGAQPFIIGHGASTSARKIFANGPYISGAAATLSGKTQNHIVLGGRWVSAAIGTCARFDALMFLVYNRLNTVAEASSICGWMQTEFGIISAGGGILVPRGYNGGMAA